MRITAVITFLSQPCSSSSPVGPRSAAFPEDLLVSTSGGETSVLGDVSAASLEGTVTQAAPSNMHNEDMLLCTGTYIKGIKTFTECIHDIYDLEVFQAGIPHDYLVRMCSTKMYQSPCIKNISATLHSDQAGSPLLPQSSATRILDGTRGSLRSNHTETVPHPTSAVVPILLWMFLITLLSHTAVSRYVRRLYYRRHSAHTAVS